MSFDKNTLITLIPEQKSIYVTNPVFNTKKSLKNTVKLTFHDNTTLFLSEDSKLLDKDDNVVSIQNAENVHCGISYPYINDNCDKNLLLYRILGY